MCNSQKITTGRTTKVLGVTFDDKLSWIDQIFKVVNKMSRLSDGLRFLRKGLAKHQSFRARSGQKYGLMY